MIGHEIHLYGVVVPNGGPAVWMPRDAWLDWRYIFRGGGE